MNEFSFKAGEGKYQVCLHALFCGKDVSVCIFGGDVPHIGAVAAGVHIDGAKKDDIAILSRNIEELMENLIYKVN